MPSLSLENSLKMSLTRSRTKEYLTALAITVTDKITYINNTSSVYVNKYTDHRSTFAQNCQYLNTHSFIIIIFSLFFNFWSFSTNELYYYYVTLLLDNAFLAFTILYLNALFLFQ